MIQSQLFRTVQVRTWIRIDFHTWDCIRDQVRNHLMAEVRIQQDQIMGPVGVRMFLEIHQ